MSTLSLPELSFSENLNNKLDCLCFSTIRLHNPKKYYLGAKLAVSLKGQLRPHPATVRNVTTFYLRHLTEGMALLDTGYSLAETRQIIEKMYKYKVTNLAQQPFDFVILGYLKSETITTQLPLL